MGKILLIQPAFTKEGTSDDRSMPLGLLYLGSYLKYRGHQVKILDRSLDRSDEHLKILLKNNYDFVGVGTFTGPMLFDAIHVSKMAKALSKSIVIWGGFHPTIMPEQTLKNDFVDHIINGEGEEIFSEVIELHDRKKSFLKVRGLDLNPPACPPDINKLPFPDYDLIDIKKYPEFYILTSRGCPYRCTFCYNSYGGDSVKPYRLLEADKAIKLIRFLVKKYKVKVITIPDDNFAADKERVKKICEGIKDLGIKYYCFARANNCDMETLHYLKKSGCWNIQIGIESGSQKILNMLKKGTTVEMNSQALRNLRKIGIASEGSLMIGLPGETIEDMHLTYEFVRKNKMDNGGIKIFQPFPKTKLWDECMAKKLIKNPPKSTEEWASRYASGFSTVVYNVSDASDEIIMNYYNAVNNHIKKGLKFRKIINYIRNRKIPHYHKIIYALKHLLAAG